jgi:hypothetical protein
MTCIGDGISGGGTPNAAGNTWTAEGLIRSAREWEVCTSPHQAEHKALPAELLKFRANAIKCTLTPKFRDPTTLASTRS